MPRRTVSQVFMWVIQNRTQICNFHALVVKKEQVKMKTASLNTKRSSSFKERPDGGAPKRNRQSKRAIREDVQAAEDLEEERRLTSLLFGTGESDAFIPPARRLQGEKQKDDTIIDGEEDTLEFEIDRTGNDEAAGEAGYHDFMIEEKSAGSTNLIKDKARPDEPAWVDEDDVGLEVNLLATSRLRKLRKSKAEVAALALCGTDLEERLRQRYQRTTQATARTDWARLSDSSTLIDKDAGNNDEDSDSDFKSLSTSLLLHSTSTRRLPPNTLNLVRCPDANQSDPNQSVLQAVHFHPASDADQPLLLTAGLDKTLRFFQVGVDKSEKVHGIHCKLMSLLCSKIRTFTISVISIVPFISP